MTKCRFFENRFVPIEYSTSALCGGDYFALCMITKGTASIEIGGERCFVSAPVLLCINPNISVQIVRENNLQIKTVLFSPDFINRNLTEKLVDTSDFKLQCKLFDFPSFDIFYNSSDIYKGIIPIEQEISPKLEYLFDSIIEQLSVQPDNMWSCRARMSVLRIFDYAASLYDNTFVCNIENDTVVDCVLNYIEFNFEKRVSIDTFCKWNNTNRTTLMREFKKVTGKTINDFVNDKRIEVSRQILDFTNLSIEEIAQKCGFENQAYFSRVFKKKLGISPSQYRRETLEKRKEYFNNK